jgi:hypothetical protein
MTDIVAPRNLRHRLTSFPPGKGFVLLMLCELRLPLRHAARIWARAAAPFEQYWSHEETDDPLYADQRNFYKVEKWSRDGQRVNEMLFAGNSLARPSVSLTVSSRRDQGRG